MRNDRLCATTARAHIAVIMLHKLLSLVASAATDPGPMALAPRAETIRIRPIRPSDLELERRFVSGLSARSRYLRLLSGRSLQPGELERWTNVDPCCEIALIALASEGGREEEEIGVARCVVEDSAEGRWDFAIVIADDWQRRGLGEALLRRLLQAATAAGVTTLGGITLAENRGMLALARKLGFSARREDGDATLMRLEMRLRA
jgi:GNAT superfamily N-acetyltransferase